MAKKLFLTLLLIFSAVALISCGEGACEHEFRDASCDLPAKCIKCGETTGEPKGHTEKKVDSKAATCTEDGFTDETVCADCGIVIKAKEKILAKGHTPVDVPATEPSCTTPGFTASKLCAECNYQIVPAQTIDALGHNEVANEDVLPDCVNAGYTGGSHCSRCNIVVKEKTPLEALGHIGEKMTNVDPSCSSVGYKDGVQCSRCEQILTKPTEIPKLPHTEAVLAGYAPSCTNVGKTDGVHCSVCKTVLTPQNDISASGHKPEKVPALEVKCTVDGKTEGEKCSVCGVYTVEPESIPAIGHDYKVEEVGNSSLYPAPGKFSCSRCESVYYTSVNQVNITYSESVIGSQGIDKKAIKISIDAEGGIGSLLYKFEVFKDANSTETIKERGFSSNKNFALSTTDKFALGQEFDSLNGMIVQVTVKDKYGNETVERYEIKPDYNQGK